MIFRNSRWQLPPFWKSEICWNICRISLIKMNCISKRMKSCLFWKLGNIAGCLGEASIKMTFNHIGLHYGQIGLYNQNDLCSFQCVIGLYSMTWTDKFFFYINFSNKQIWLRYSQLVSAVANPARRCVFYATCCHTLHFASLQPQRDHSIACFYLPVICSDNFLV